MGGSFGIGRYLGIDLKVHWTFFLLFAFFGALGYMQTGSFLGTVLVAGLIVALFVCVVLHEYGHALVAKRLGIGVRDIILLPIGGMARLERLPEKAWDEVKIAIAGPPVNIVLAAIFYGGAYLVYGASPFTLPDISAAGEAPQNILLYLGFINVLLAVFNLLPALPLDGGRVFRGLLATQMDRVKATNIAALTGQAFAVLFFLFGLLTFNIILALVAVFIFLAASGEAQMAQQREVTRGLQVADVMRTRDRTETLSPHHNFDQVLEALIHGHQEDFPVIGEDGRVVGMLTRNKIFNAASSPEQRLQEVRELMETDFMTVSPRADLFNEAFKPLQESDFGTMLVVEDGEFVGMLTMKDLGQAMLLQRRAGKNGQTR